MNQLATQQQNFLALREEVMQELTRTLEKMQLGHQYTKAAQTIINDNIAYTAFKVYGTGMSIQALMKQGMNDGMLPDAQQFFLALRQSLFITSLEATQVANDAVINELRRALEQGVPDQRNWFDRLLGG